MRGARILMRHHGVRQCMDQRLLFPLLSRHQRYGVGSWFACALYFCVVDAAVFAPRTRRCHDKTILRLTVLDDVSRDTIKRRVLVYWKETLSRSSRSERPPFGGICVRLYGPGPAAPEGAIASRDPGLARQGRKHLLFRPPSMRMDRALRNPERPHAS